MTGYILRRLLQLAFTAFIVVLLVFFLIHLVPGDPVALMLGDQASLEEQQQLRALLHLDQPLLQQLGSFLSDALRGHLGTDIVTREKVEVVLIQRIPYTLVLSAVALLIACAISFPLGILSSVFRGRWIDALGSITSLLGISLPTFWLGPLLLMLFSVHLGIFPISGADHAGSIVLPAFTLGASLSAFLTRMVRASMIEILDQEYIRVASAKGLHPTTVICKHALRNAMIPILTVLGTQFGALMAGAVITESIFDWPGIGSYFFRSFQQRNYPVIQACVLFISLSTMLINFFVDLMYQWVDPRVKLQ